MKQISLIEAEYIAFELVNEMLKYDEPIPDFASRYPNILESCLAQPFQEFDGKQLYPTYTEKTALLFYLITKNHPFKNGNKRMAVMLMIYFLYKNGMWIEALPDDIYKIAMRIAKSKANEKDKTLKRLRRDLDRLIVKKDFRFFRKND